ncbi:unnamed protein product, partial [Didymodactylos carnosus]
SYCQITEQEEEIVLTLYNRYKNSRAVANEITLKDYGNLTQYYNTLDLTAKKTRRINGVLARSAKRVALTRSSDPLMFWPQPNDRFDDDFLNSLDNNLNEPKQQQNAQTILVEGSQIDQELEQDYE